MLVGSNKDIEVARNHRKLLGGTLRQAGVFTACGLVALEDWREYLLVDHENARYLANELASIPGVIVDPTIVETNILRYTIEPKYLKKLKVDYKGFSKQLKEQYGVLCNAGFANDNMRMVTHRDVSHAQC